MSDEDCSSDIICLKCSKCKYFRYPKDYVNDKGITLKNSIFM